jgi:hypothetical protein
VPGCEDDPVKTAGCAAALLAAVLTACSSGGGGIVQGKPTILPPTSRRSATSTSASGSTPADHGYRVTLPPGWKQESTTPSGTLATYSGPVADNFGTNVNVTSASVGGLDLDAFVRQTQQYLRTALHITALTGPVPRSLDGEAAFEYNYRWTYGGHPLRQRQTLSIHHGQGFVITYTAAAPAYSEGLADADAIVSSWKWTS